MYSCHVTAWSTWHMTCWVGLLILVTIPLSLCTLCLVKVKIKYFWSVTWLCGWGSLIFSHHPAKFGVHRSYGTGNMSICNISSSSNTTFNSNAEVYKCREKGQKELSFYFNKFLYRNEQSQDNRLSLIRIADFVV